MKTAEVTRVMNKSADTKGPDTFTHVNLYKNNKLFGFIDASSKSQHYINDIIENWENGILGEDNEYIRKPTKSPVSSKRKTSKS